MDPTTRRNDAAVTRDDVLDTLSTLAVLLDRTIDEVKPLGSNSLVSTLVETRAKLGELRARRENEYRLLRRELERVEVLIRDISTVINDPDAALPVFIQKDVERSELESYVRGIRFGLQGGHSK